MSHVDPNLAVCCEIMRLTGMIAGEASLLCIVSPPGLGQHRI